MKRLLVLFLLLSLSLQPLWSTSANAQGKLDLKVKAEGSWNCLRLAISNVSETELRLPLHVLPWGSLTSIQLVGLATKSHQLIKPSTAVSIPLAGSFVLAKDQAMPGTIDLRNYLPDVATELTSQDVVLFWAYDPLDESQNVIARQQGALRLFQTTQPGRNCL